MEFNVSCNAFLNAMKTYKYTENGAAAKTTTNSGLYDLFALGAAYRSRTDSDCEALFAKAFNENPVYALRCLAYIRDIESGQGERRFFRVCLHWLAKVHPEIVMRNLETLVKGNYCRWDDTFCLFDTPVESTMLSLVKTQLYEDMDNDMHGKAVSLLAKWMPSINTSSVDTRKLATRFVKYLGIDARRYRKMLSFLREKIHIVERLMSQNRWNEIEFDKLPSKAGIRYHHAFTNNPITADKYAAFAQSNKKVNASTLFPYEVVRQARAFYNDYRFFNDSTERAMINKYWDNLTDYFNGANLNALVVCDTSASMLSGCGRIAPIDIAISLAMYAAEKASDPFHSHYISFSRNARLVEVTGNDFIDKVHRIVASNVCEDTNLESVFNLVLNTAMRANLTPEQMPTSLIIVSDMEVNMATTQCNVDGTFMDAMRRKWHDTCNGKYKFPEVYFWNVSARNDTFLSDAKTGITFVSGASPALFQQIMRGLSGEQLMFDTLNSERYAVIT